MLFLLSADGTEFYQDVVAHINHIRAVAGVEHVGIGDIQSLKASKKMFFRGGDYNGIPYTPVGLEDVSHYPEVSDMQIINLNYIHGLLSCKYGLSKYIHGLLKYIYAAS